MVVCALILSVEATLGSRPFFSGSASTKAAVTLASRNESGPTVPVVTDSEDAQTIWKLSDSTRTRESVRRSREELPSEATDSRPRKHAHEPADAQATGPETESSIR